MTTNAQIIQANWVSKNEFGSGADFYCVSFNGEKADWYSKDGDNWYYVGSKRLVKSKFFNSVKIYLFGGKRSGETVA